MNKEATSSYLELATQAYGLITEAFESNNRRALEFLKSTYEITTRPYASTALETAARENFDRANQLMALTVAELQTSGQKATEYGSKLVEHATKMQESATTAMRGMVDTSISNMTFVKETTSQQIDQIAKNLDDASQHATTQMSPN